MLWKYQHDDKTTWKYIDVQITGSIVRGTAFVKKWVLNPDFKYKHLDKNYEGDINHVN